MLLEFNSSHVNTFVPIHLQGCWPREGKLRFVFSQLVFLVQLSTFKDFFHLKLVLHWTAFVKYDSHSVSKRFMFVVLFSGHLCRSGAGFTWVSVCCASVEWLGRGGCRYQQLFCFVRLKIRKQRRSVRLGWFKSCLKNQVRLNVVYKVYSAGATKQSLGSF